jgi:hypothetical protein
VTKPVPWAPLLAGGKGTYCPFMFVNGVHDWRRDHVRFELRCASCGYTVTDRDLREAMGKRVQ